MPDSTAVTGRSADDHVLAPGTLVGGRFEVGEPLAFDALGVVIAARDTKTDAPIFLRVLRPRFVDERTALELRAEARVAAEHTHRTVLGTFGVGTTSEGALYVATEAVDGKPLCEVLAEHARTNRPVSLRGALNVVANVCKALAHAEERQCHGALRPSVVWLSRQGRVKVGDYGIGRVLVARHGASAVGPAEQGFLAPEVRAGGAPDVRSDIYGLGALLYQLLTGRPAADGFVPPSQVHPDATGDVDAVVFRCLSAAPEGRYASADELRAALLPAMVAAPPANARDDFGLEEHVEIDVDIAIVVPPTDPAIDLARFARAQGGAAVAGTSIASPSAPTRAQSSAMKPSSSRASTVDLPGALARISKGDAPRWMAEIDGMDHGPFTGRELVDQLAKGQIKLDHRIHNMDTGDRREVSGFPDFAVFAQQWEREQQSKQHKESVHAAAASDHRSSRAKLAFAAVGLLGAVAAAGYFLVTRGAAERREARDQEVSSLYDIGQIQASASGDVLPDPAATGGRRAGGGTHAAGNAAGAGTGAHAAGAGGADGESAGGHEAGSFEDAMNRVVDFGDLSQGAMTQLTGPQVAEIMNRHVGRIYGACVPAEQSRGGELGRVQIDMAIAGDGHVLGASSRQGSPAFKSCIGRAISSIRFPTFNSPRMAARYSFDTN